MLGLVSTHERRVLDWQWRDHTDRLFGCVQHRAEWCKLADIESEDRWLTEDWDDDSGPFIRSFVKSDASGWTAHLVWGFQTTSAGRYQVRRVLVRKGLQSQQARLVYNYQGPCD